MVTFVNFSGGLDSAYFLWRWAEENRGTSNRIVVHHCLYSKRKDMEQKACEGIMAELKKMGFTNYEYVTTTCNFPKKPTRDIIVMAAMGGLSARMYKVDRVMLTYSKEESPELHRWLVQYKTINNFDAAHRYTIANKMFDMAYRKNRVEYYLIDQHKGLVGREDMVRQLPDNILRHVSFCRNPSEEKRICGTCFTCRRTVKYLKTHGKLKLFV